MSYREPARTAARRTRWTVLAALVIVSATITGVLMWPRASSPTASLAPAASPPVETPQRDHKRDFGEADGALPDGVTVFDDGYPGITNLDPDLLEALREAAKDAAANGVKLYVNSGWRSPERQEQLLREAISKYGSEEEAARWVATADTSPHVSGDAVDIGQSNATTWLSEHGAEYGLCQIYGNEPWHYELRPEAIDDGCPRMYADPSQDPKMRQ
ncbi:M15 family metallopeptidase [Streptomyces sp. NBC_00287]|uniref:M15 family metallopeptidase n=1 Tax=Streptomyces sp. NBC_00287 TaxID=2975702 RepID=UPI002E2A2B92|nr:M15 family metallopeptidase [Streptomyces sp. NBC_00287]